MTHSFIKKLMKDHGAQRDAAQKLTESRTAAKKDKYRQALFDLLYPHMQGEDASVFPYLQEVMDENNLGVLMAMEEHQFSVKILNELMSTDLDDKRFNAKAKVLIDFKLYHMNVEEETHFSLLAKHADDRDLDELFEVFRSAEEKFADWKKLYVG